MSRYRMDPILAKRYGLIPQKSTAIGSDLKSTSTQAPLRKPSEVEVSARQNCPRVLIHLWPGFGAIQHRPINQFLDTSNEAYFQARLPWLPKADLAELAQRCLQSMTNGLPLSPSAEPR